LFYEVRALKDHLERDHCEDDDEVMIEHGINPKLLKRRPRVIRKNNDIRNYLRRRSKAP